MPQNSFEKHTYKTKNLQLYPKENQSKYQHLSSQTYLPQSVSFGLINGVHHSYRHTQDGQCSYKPPQHCGPYWVVIVV